MGAVKAEELGIGLERQKREIRGNHDAARRLVVTKHLVLQSVLVLGVFQHRVQTLAQHDEVAVSRLEDEAIKELSIDISQLQVLRRKTQIN